MKRTRKAVIAAARRTPVAPRGGALAAFQADDLAAPVLATLIADAGIAPQQVDHVLLGNALYAGGNPARLAALRAGIPQNVPAMTIDTQCCSGLDAILLGIRMIEAGAADCVLAGGAESFSRAPIRMHRPLTPDEAPVAYSRPAFAPQPFNDPDLAEAAAQLAAERGYSRQAQASYAVRSHDRATAAGSALADRNVRVPDAPVQDGFTRALSLKAALRAPVLAGDSRTGLSAATIACEADAAAAVLLVSEETWDGIGGSGLPVIGGMSIGGDPGNPAGIPDTVGSRLLGRHGLRSADLSAVELMEAYAPQAMATAEALSIAQDRLNVRGGALARGHPIGASGAILAVTLYDLLAYDIEDAKGAEKTGMALIAAAGGLGTGLLVGGIGR